MVAESLTRMMPGEGRRRLTFDEQTSVEDVLDAAQDWEDGKLPLEAFASVGDITNYRDQPSPGYTRFVARFTTPESDPRRAALIRAQDALIRLEGWIVTNHGVFSADDLRGTGITVKGR